MSKQPQQVNLAAILTAVRANGDNLGRELGGVKKLLAGTREDSAALQQQVTDHVADSGKHPTQPCAAVTLSGWMPW